MTTDLRILPGGPSAPPPVAAAPVTPAVALSETALARAIEADRKTGSIKRFLRFTARKRGVPDADLEDVVSRAMLLALEREGKGKHWDPKEQVVLLYIGKLLVDHVLPSHRRTRRRKGFAPLPESGYEGMSGEANPEAELVDQLHADRQAVEVRNGLAAQTATGLTLRIIDARRAGIHSHDDLATHLGVSVEDIRNAFKRIRRRVAAVCDSGREDVS